MAGGPACKTKETRGFFCKRTTARRRLTGTRRLTWIRSNLSCRLRIRRLRCCAGTGGGDWLVASGDARRCAAAQGGFGAGVLHSPRGKHLDVAKLAVNASMAARQAHRRLQRCAARRGRWQCCTMSGECAWINPRARTRTNNTKRALTSRQNPWTADAWVHGDGGARVTRLRRQALELGF
jgi:hypothetical protein